MSLPFAIPRLLIAATASGAGKTTITAGLIAVLRRRGLIVQPFKCGPDYVDPSYHTLAAGRPCRNLDGWMLDESQLVATFMHACEGADIAIIEGVMGVFDGSSWLSDAASSAHIARMLSAPIALVLDISAAARSAAIAVAGCQRIDPQLDLRAVFLNFAGSKSHADGCASAIESLTGVPSLGWLAREEALQIPERHLGLVPGPERSDTQSLIDRIADQVETQFAIEPLIDVARHSAPLPDSRARMASPEIRVHDRPVLAVARDEAFCFYYPENLELLAQQGVRIEYFSPIRGESPSVQVAGVYFGGGYPELHARELSSNAGLWTALRTLHSRAAPIYAECGGFMVLTEGVLDISGQYWPMAGLIPGRTVMSSGLVALGYRYATSAGATLLTPGAATLRGHEFHYSRWERERGDGPVASAWRVRGTAPDAIETPEGFAQGNLLASYLHVHFGQCDSIARQFAGKLRHP